MFSRNRVPAFIFTVVTLAAGLLLTSSPAGGVAGFGDVPQSAFYTNAVQWMVDNAITTGTSATCYSPADPVTRGQAAAFMWRMEGEPAAAPHSFTDVTAGYQQGPVSWMAATGITTGTSPSTYSPDRELTRGQLAALLHRLAGRPDASIHPFDDIVAPWQQAPVAWMVANDITTGTSPTRFSPDDTVTRGQLATFFHRYAGTPDVTIDLAHPTSPGCTQQAPGPPDPEPDPGGDGSDCVVRLHGKGGNGGDPFVDGDVVELYPTGNAPGWGARQWLYFPDTRYDEAVTTVEEAVDAADCDKVVINGFSNGAAFAAKLFCSGESFDDRVIGVVIDDPVTDLAVEGCAPADGVTAVLYWTGGLASSSAPGTECPPMDWTCEGDELLGIDAYAAALGVAAQASIHNDHQWYWDAPEIRNLLT